MIVSCVPCHPYLAIVSVCSLKGHIIKAIYDKDPMLAAQALRLSFHDCVGGCDGCVNVAQAANIGLGRINDILDKDWDKQRWIIGKANYHI